MAAVVGRVAGKPAGDVGTSVARFARRHGKRYIDLDRVTDERVVMLGAKKEQLETGSGAHKIERIRLATGVADPRLQKRDLKRRRRRAQRLDHLRAAGSGLFHIHGCSGCRSDTRYEERRVGEEVVRQCRSRWET